MNDAGPVAVCRGLSRTLPLPGGGRLEVLREVDLVVQPGESVAIQGRSGSGKSTLLALLGLLDEPTAGEYRLGWRPVKGLPDRELAALRGRAIGFVFQRFFLLDQLNVEANVRLALVHGGRGLNRADALVTAALAAVGLAERRAHLPRQLSGGEQQRVAIARALVAQPRLILADEPTGALDEATSEGVVETLVSVVREQGAAMVMVTHDPAVAAHCDRVLHLHQGRLGER